MCSQYQVCRWLAFSDLAALPVLVINRQLGWLTLFFVFFVPCVPCAVFFGVDGMCHGFVASVLGVPIVLACWADGCHWHWAFWQCVFGTTAMEAFIV